MRLARDKSITSVSSIRGATLAIWIGAATCRADTVMQDSFDYADATELTAGGWVTVAGTPAVSGQYYFDGTTSGFMSSDPAVRPVTQDGYSLLRLANAAAFRQLPVTVSDDWSITVSTLMNAYARSEYVAVTDDIGNGYGLRWNGTNPSQNGGRGVLSINKLTGWPAGTFANGAQIGSSTVSLQFPTGVELPVGYSGSESIPYRDPLGPDFDPGFLGFSTLVLSWSSTAHMLTLAQFGDEDFVTLTSVVDAQFNAFSRVYVGGGTSSFFDNVTFEAVPEPAALGQAALATTALMTRRRTTGN